MQKSDAVLLVLVDERCLLFKRFVVLLVVERCLFCCLIGCRRCSVVEIRETWYQLYRRQFLQQSLVTANDCRKGFYYYQKGFEETGVRCHSQHSPLCSFTFSTDKTGFVEMITL